MDQEQREYQRIIAFLQEADSEEDWPDNDDEVEDSSDHVSVRSEPRP